LRSAGSGAAGSRPRRRRRGGPPDRSRDFRQGLAGEVRRFVPRAARGDRGLFPASGHSDPHSLDRPRHGGAVPGTAQQTAGQIRARQTEGRVMSDQADLSQLADIVVPASVAWWPPAPGWWVVAEALLIVAAIAIHQAVVRYRRNAYRRVALA